MGEFGNIAEGIASALEEMKHEGGVSVDRIPEIISSLIGNDKIAINCYPGLPGYHCCDLSFFVSLSSPSHKKGNGHLYFGKALERIVQHMQGVCIKKTRAAILITDNWDDAVFEEWLPNFEQIKTYAHIEAYLLAGRSVNEITI